MDEMKPVMGVDEVALRRKLASPVEPVAIIGKDWQLNDGHWVEAIHTAHLAQDFFNEHVREHVLVEHLEKTNPDFAAKLEVASDALYAVYNTVAQLAPESPKEDMMPDTVSAGEPET